MLSRRSTTSRPNLQSSVGRSLSTAFPTTITTPGRQPKEALTTKGTITNSETTNDYSSKQYSWFSFPTTTAYKGGMKQGKTKSNGDGKPNVVLLASAITGALLALIIIALIILFVVKRRKRKSNAEITERSQSATEEGKGGIPVNSENDYHMRISPPEIRVDHAKSHINENFHPESFDQNTYMRSDSGQPLLEQATNKYNHDDHTYGNIGQQINELPPRINPRSSSLGHTLSNKGRQKLQHGVDQTPTKNFPSHSPTNRTFPVTIRSPKSPTSNETLYLNDRHPSKKDEESERPPLPSPRSTTLEDKSFTNSIANDIEDRPPLPTPRTRSLDVTLSNELKSSRKANSGRVVRSGNSSPEQSSVRPPLPIPRSELLSTLSGKASEATTKALSDMNSSKRSFSEASTLDRQKAPSTLNARGRVPDFPNSKSAISSLDNDDVFYRNLAGEHSNSSDISNGDDFYHVLEPSDETDSGDIIQDPFYQVLETYEEPDFVERDMENIGESRTVRPHTKVAVDDNIYDEFDSPDENIRNESKGSPVSIDSGICSDNGPFDKYYQALDEVTQEPYATLSRHK